MREDGKIDYVELPGGELIPTTRFYEAAFGWTFTDYGPEYAAFDEGLEGGFQLRVCSDQLTRYDFGFFYGLGSSGFRFSRAVGGFGSPALDCFQFGAQDGGLLLGGNFLFWLDDRLLGRFAPRAAALCARWEKKHR